MWTANQYLMVILVLLCRGAHELLIILLLNSFCGLGLAMITDSYSPTVVLTVRGDNFVISMCTHQLCSHNPSDIIF